MSTFGELFEQAEQEIRAHIESAAGEFTNYFVVQGAVLLASIRLWAQLCGKTATDQRAMIEADKSSLEKVVEDLAETADPEGVMASQLLKAIVNRPESFVAEVRRWASRAFADGKGERQSTDPYDRPMPVLWSCPDPNCPTTAIVPVDVPESGEEAGVEAEARFTTDEVARLLNVPLHTIHKWHQEGTGPPGYQMHKDSHYRRSEVVRWLAEQGVMLATCQSDCGGTYRLSAFTTVEG
ncbi:MAG TPA: helix-turn-helix domain-containing protein [Propionibacteriaceae bacterium]|nr:helix-turn-helix domain-containing protein [Propionibacteriaceae bacterium]